MEFKDMINQRRIELNMTMEELAKLIGVSTPTIQRYESGEIKNVRRDKIKLLADALQCSAAYLMGWEDKAPNYNVVTQIEQDIIQKYRSLDSKGKHTIDTVLEMEYNRCHKPHLIPFAAHAKDGHTKVDIQNDLDMMDDDKF